MDDERDKSDNERKLDELRAERKRQLDRDSAEAAKSDKLEENLRLEAARLAHPDADPNAITYGDGCTACADEYTKLLIAERDKDNPTYAEFVEQNKRQPWMTPEEIVDVLVPRPAVSDEEHAQAIRDELGIEDDNRVLGDTFTIFPEAVRREHHEHAQARPYTEGCPICEKLLEARPGPLLTPFRREIKPGHEVDSPEALERENARRREEGLPEIGSDAFGGVFSGVRSPEGAPPLVGKETMDSEAKILEREGITPAISDEVSVPPARPTSVRGEPGMDAEAQRALNDAINAEIARQDQIPPIGKTVYVEDTGANTVYNAGDVPTENRWEPKDGHVFDPADDHEQPIPRHPVLPHYDDVTMGPAEEMLTTDEIRERAIKLGIIPTFNEDVSPFDVGPFVEEMRHVAESLSWNEKVRREASRLAGGGISYGGPLEEAALKLLEYQSALATSTNVPENRPRISELRSNLKYAIGWDGDDVRDIRNIVIGGALAALAWRKLR